VELQSLNGHSLALTDEEMVRTMTHQAALLLDRGWGKPPPTPQRHTGEDDKDIRITLRQITEGRR
jgi:hypothetical protein